MVGRRTCIRNLYACKRSAKSILALNECIKEVEKEEDETQKKKEGSTTNEQEMNRKIHS
jgi:hypothetical protein